MPRTKKWLAAMTAVVVAACVSLWLALPELAKRAAVEKAAEAGWEADVGRVEITWQEAVLKDVRLKSADGWATAYAGEIRVRRDGTSVGDVTARGVRAKLKGKRPKREAGGGGEHRKLAVTDAEVEWEGFAGEGSTMRVRGLSAETGSPRSARADLVEAEVGSGSFVAREAEVAGDTIRVQRLEASIRAPLPGGPAVPGGTEEEEAGEGEEKRLEADAFTLSTPYASVEGRGLSLTVRRSGEATEAEVEVLEAKSEAAAVAEAKASVVAFRNSDAWKIRASAEGLLTVRRTKAVGTDLTVKAKADIEAEGSTDPLRFEVKSAALETGSLTVRASGSYGGGIAEVKAEMPEIGCQEAFDSLPHQVVGDLSGTRMEGRFKASAVLRVDLPERQTPEVRLDVQNGCRIKEVPERFDLGRLARPFTRVAVTADGKDVGVVSGPGTKYWVPIQAVSRHLTAAVMATEDVGFLGHRGVLVKAVEKALELDIKEGRFARGASTITMQLAKNLWLGREKTAARKLQEAILATYLEQRWDKGQILEYYVNLAEFAPGVYGVGEASHHYFRTDATQLTLSQSLMMALALPSPSRPQFSGDGEPMPGRLALARRVMRSMRDSGKISDEELAEALAEVPVLGGPVRTSAVQDIKESEEGVSPDWK